MPATGFEDYQSPSISTLLAAMPSGPSQDYQQARFGLTGQYPTDVQQNEAEAMASRLAGSPYERANALARWVSGANIAAGVPGPRFGALKIVKPVGTLAEAAEPTINRAVRGLGREYIQYMRDRIARGWAVPTNYTLGPEYPTGQYIRSPRGAGGPLSETVLQSSTPTAASSVGMAPKQILQHELTHGKFANLPERIKAFAEQEMGEISANFPGYGVSQFGSPAEGIGARIRGYTGRLTPSEVFAMTGEGARPGSPFAPLASPYQEAGESLHRIIRNYLAALQRPRSAYATPRSPGVAPFSWGLTPEAAESLNALGGVTP